MSCFGFDRLAASAIRRGVGRGGSSSNSRPSRGHSLSDDLSLNVSRACRIARGVQRGRMLPNVRLLIAAMLASILVLMCGFGVFAAFRVSHEPIAYLPAAMAPLQLVAEIRAVPSTALVARETVDQHSQSDIPVSAPEEITPPTGTAEQHDPAEFATESKPTAAPQPSAAADVEPTASGQPEKEAAAMAPA